ncbi:MAG: cyclic pyranopterin monophosphate synthase MoaC [Thermomicrobiales bacterium]
MDRNDSLHVSVYNAGMDEQRLTHFDASGRARMVDVGAKAETERVAVARGTVEMQADTLQLILEGRAKKGDVLAVAQVAGIMAAKRTHELIPMCHPLLLTGIEVAFVPDLDASALHITATVRTFGKTGVEMEALTAVSATALTVYDMVKAVDRGMTITAIRLAEKRGGKSGDFIHPDERDTSS